MANESLEDRMDIRDLIDRYSDAVIRRDKERWRATWAEDAVWHIRSNDVKGRDAIVATWEKAMAGFDSVWFSAFPGSIAVTGDTAMVTTHTLEYLVPTGSQGKLQSGIYEDRLVRTENGWCFAERTFTPHEMNI